MADVSSLHRRCRQQSTADAVSFVVDEEEPNIYIFDYDYISPPNPAFYNPPFVDFSFDPNPLSDSESEKSDSDGSASFQFPNPFFYSNEEEVSFVTDLFQPRDGPVSDDDVDRVFGGVFNGASANVPVELGLGEFDAVVLSSESHGLRVVGMESESDSEDADVQSAISDPNGSLRECVRFNDQDEEFEWEEVNERDEERENLSSLIDRIEEISVSSGITSSEGENPISENGEEEEELRNLEWEVLLAVNNLERHLELESDVIDGEVSYLNIHDDYIYAADHDPLFGQFSDGALKGSPPAAKHIVDNLPSVILIGEADESKVSCVVCKDDILVGETVNRLPCSHHYHHDCIVPWLSIRNTCPVCRHELPTDDAEYEKKKHQRHTNPLNDFEVRYNFEILP
nr:E3 ubiquitin-protein ligase Praja-2-like [Ipomoea batatas]